VGSVDTARVLELYIPAVRAGGGSVGSGYRVGPDVALTAAHVVANLPLWRPGELVPAEADAPGVCLARPLGENSWVPAVVAWRDDDKDVAVLRLASTISPLPAGSPLPRWGRVEGVERVAVSAVGFPWAQERPDHVRDSEQLFGFVAPATTVKTGHCAVTVLSAAPADRAGSSPWAGMSGAALFAGPFLVGVLVIDPPGFSPDRVVAAPVAPLLAELDLAKLLETTAEQVVGVGPRFRLAVTAETSVALAPPYRAPTTGLGREPARLLLPEHGIVPFAGRESDLETLASWCLTAASSALKVITGEGGSGKTRLAAEACVRMTGNGWQAGFADRKVPGGAVQLEFGRPTLLVVDDANLNVALLADLVRTVGYWPPGAPPVRLLLLARHTGGWWDTLNRRTDHLAWELADSPLQLHEGGLAPADRAEHHARALTAFAAHVPDPARPSGQTLPVLADPVFTNPLLVHMHALLTVCGAQVPTTGGAVRERILDTVLDRERDRWAETFPPSVPTGGTRTHQQAVTAATLVAPPTETATAQTMTVIGELRPDAAAGARAAVVTWLRELYPGSDPPWVAPLRPDLLAEQLLASCPQLTDLVLGGYSDIAPPGQLEQLLTELTRADTRIPVREALDKLLTLYLPGLLTAAIDRPSGRLPDLLAVALARCPQAKASATLISQLPDRSTGLAALAATLASQAVDYYRQLTAARPDAFTPDLARSLNNLSSRLGDLGRLEDALAAVEDAVNLYRQLAAAQPDAFIPDLAQFLHNLSSRLAAVGRFEDALAAVEEAVSLYRRLVAARPDAFTAHLAQSLNNLSSRLAAVGRREDALAAVEEAVSLYRRLVAARPDAFTAHLAQSLNNLSSRLAAVGRREDALTAVEQAVSLHRQLAATWPDAFTPDLAGSLNSLSNRLGDLGRLESTLAAIEEAVRIRRQLAAARPDPFTPDLAMSLNNLSNRLGDLGRLEDALVAIEEAVSFYRQLAAARPGPFTPKLAMSLNNLAVQLGSLGRLEDALAAIEEAVSLRRQLVAARPEAFTPDLAQSLHNLSSGLGALGRREDALAAVEEAVSLRRQLVVARPDAFIPDLARSLHSLSHVLAGQGPIEDALAAVEEAASLYRQLAAARPDAFTPDLARSLDTLSNQLADLSRLEDAVTAGRQAVDLYCSMHATRPELFHIDLENALRNLAAYLRSLHQDDEAEQIEQRATTLTDQP
jgi:tetratricopeptide (TPR) repeat protein